MVFLDLVTMSVAISPTLLFTKATLQKKWSVEPYMQGENNLQYWYQLSFLGILDLAS